MNSYAKNANSKNSLSESKFLVKQKNVEAQDKTSMPDIVCSCDRKPKGMYCSLCNTFTPNVRVRRTCLRHPNIIWLMDLQRCPNCFEDTNLEEFYGLLSSLCIIVLTSPTHQAKVAGQIVLTDYQNFIPLNEHRSSYILQLMYTMGSKVKRIRYIKKRINRKLTREKLNKSESAQDETSLLDLPCICDRKPTGVYCHHCKTFTPNVRFRRVCPRHPQTGKLTDLPGCPNCSKATLQELREAKTLAGSNL